MKKFALKSLLAAGYKKNGFLVIFKMSKKPCPRACLFAVINPRHVWHSKDISASSLPL
jgi:hypothetical protein